MKWLLDEMLSPAAAVVLGRLGHDARAAREAGLGGAPDDDVFDLAVREGRIIVTENVADFAVLLERRLAADEPCVPVVFVRRARLPAGGALGPRLARLLDDFARERPEPYVGAHWAGG